MKNQRKLPLKILWLSFLLCILPGLLTGCGRLQNALEVGVGIKQVLPEAKVLNLEKGRRSNVRYKYKKYTVDNKGVVFTYKNYQGQDTMFGTTQAYYMNDYCEKLFEHFGEEMDRISEKYGVELDIGYSSVWIKHDISHMKDIDKGVNAMEEIYTIIRDYLPEKGLYWFEFSIFLSTGNFGRPQIILVEKPGDWDADYYRQLLYMNLKDAANDGLANHVEKPQEMLNAIPQKYIRNLYINGEPYHSDKYEIRFLYNIRNGKYYTPVGFGIELEYNGGVEDYLQREIIEHYYPDSEYTISMEDKTSSYKIGKDEFLVKRQEIGEKKSLFKRQEEHLVFLKNGVELPIVHEEEISDTHAGAVYYYWVSVEDFAMIMGMSVDKVEDGGVYLMKN